MAVPGLSGSAGGISLNHVTINPKDLNIYSIIEKHPYPMDVSYFVNNVCNLKCRHCYVAYNNKSNSLNYTEWMDIFNNFIDMGALTFGNVGKEPTLSWELTKDLLFYFKEKRKIVPKLRYGIVTNGTLLNEIKINDLIECTPDYIDISLDGDEKSHDYIRGDGAFNRLMQNLALISTTKLVEKIFIVFTINKATINSLPKTIDIIYNFGIKKILFSPYITVKDEDDLYLTDNFFCDLFKKMIDGSVIDFVNHKNLTIYIKNDYSTTLELMQKMVQLNIINLNKLFIDEYGVIFVKYELPNNNKLIISYIPFDNNYNQMIRISHDGYLSNCLDMFYNNYPERAIGNIREKGIKEILENANIHSAALAI